MILRAIVCLLAFSAAAADRRGWFGLSFSHHTSSAGVPFLRLCAVVPNGPAARAGLKAGDVITHIGGNAVAFRNAQETLAHFAGVKPNARVSLRVMRGSRSFDAVLTVAPPPPAPSRSPAPAAPAPSASR